MIRPTRRAQPYRKRSPLRKQGPALKAMLGGSTLRGKNPMSARRRFKKAHRRRRYRSRR